MTKTTLNKIASISAGHPLRDRVEPVDDGELLLVQLKDVSLVNGISLKEIFKIHPRGKKKPDFLREGDILFVNRGMRFFGVLVDRPLPQAVAAPHFFVVRADPRHVLPAYLAWFLNHKRAKKYFSQCAAGSALPHVTSKTLGDLPVIVPEMKIQQNIVSVYNCLLTERKTAEYLLDKKSLLISEILDRALSDAYRTGEDHD